MTPRSWIRKVFARPVSRPIRRAAGRPRLGVEPLEDRAVPATFTVTNTSDFGVGSLRDAVAAANGAAGPDDIVFDTLGVFATAQTITVLTPITFNATDLTTVTGTAAGVTVSGGGSSQVFFVDPGALVALDKLTVSSGSSTNGGALRNQGTLTVTASTFSGSTATDGGALYSDSGSTTTLTNVTFGGNTASGIGGAIYNSGTLTLAFSTVSGNSAGVSGGGVDNQGSATLRNTIVAGNTASPDWDVGGIFTSGGYNLIGKTNGSSGWVGTDLTGTNAAPLDPLLNALGDNGGPTQTFLPQGGSPAVGAGDNTGGPATDQRGVARVAGTGGTIGAVEGAAASVFTVTTTNDSGAGSLRQAILDANATAGADTIAFAIPGAGPHTIAPTSFLPSIDQTVVIDGTSQPGYAGTPLIEISGQNAGNSHGLVANVAAASNSIIQGLVINRFQLAGVYLAGGSLTGVVIQNNYIGTDVTGTLSRSNGGQGVGIQSSPGHTVRNNLISGNGAGVTVSDFGIPGSATGNVIVGNRIGINATGTAALPNQVGISIGAANTIVGGVAASDRNVISGNTSAGNVGAGISLDNSDATGTSILGNYIGLAPDGSTVISNDTGVRILNGASGNTVGGTTAAARNVISGNTGSGISLFGATVTGTRIRGNYIGTNAAGTAAVGNDTGIEIGGGASGNVVGTDGDGANDAAERNVISGNLTYGVDMNGANNNRIAGNYIGTTAAGDAALINGFSNVATFFSTGNIIGTDGSNDAFNANERNVISGGIILQNANVLAGNYIGINAAGTAALTVGAGLGVQVSGTTGSRVGTNADGVADAEERNVISGVNGTAVLVSQPGAVIAGNFIGTNAAGTAAVANLRGVELVSSVTGVRIGTNADGVNDAAEGNLISGNSVAGVQIGGTSSGTVVAGNTIGLNLAGTAALPNGTGIQIDGGASSNTIGGTLAATRNVISGNTGTGVLISGSGATGNVVAGNFIGLDAGGTLNRGNGGSGVRVDTGATNNTVGGTSAAARNVISGNSDAGVYIFAANNGTGFTTVSGNYIGTDKTGAAKVGNGVAGVHIWTTLDPSNNTIGGTTAGAGNLISGNFGSGIWVEGSDNNLIAGNTIGLAADGDAPLGNTGIGVRFSNSSTGNTVGGTTALARNVIAGNDYGVAFISPGTAGNTVIGNYIGTDATGALDRGNTTHGIWFNNASANTIGGSAAGQGNVISGNNGSGIYLDSSNSNGTVIQGNLIGTNALGTTALGNSGAGVVILGGATNTTVGGTAAGAGNVISGNGNAVTPVGGVYLSGSGTSGNVVAGNLIGTDKTGTVALGNLWAGVGIESGAGGNTVGGTVAGARNVISGNASAGVEINSVGGTANVVRGNLIGTAVNGTAPLGNGNAGVLLRIGASGNFVGGIAAGEANTIAYNATAGVDLRDPTTTGNAIRGNSIHSNTGLGIDLGGDGVTTNDPADADAGPNGRQNYPLLSFVGGGAVTNPRGTLAAAPNSTYTLDFYANDAVDPSGYGEGKRYLGSATVNTNAVGTAVVSVNLAAATTTSEFVTATATDASGNTSEFAQSIQTNLPPTVALATPAEARVGITLPFTPVLTDAVPGKTYRYSWAVAFNGSPVALPNATYVADGASDQETYFFTPQRVGSYVVAVTVTDSRGGVTTATSAPIQVVGTTLGVTITGNPLGTPVPFAVAAGVPVTLTSRIADPRQPATDPKTGLAVAPAYTYEWSVTLGGVPFALPVGTVTTAPTLTFTPTAGGLYLASLAVRDGTKAAGADSVSLYNTGAPAPQIIARPGTAVAAGTVVELQALVADAALRPGLSYTWTVTLDNGTPTTATNATGVYSFTPTAAGTYAVTLTVADGQGRTGTVGTEIRVARATPRLTISGAPQTTLPGAALTLTGTATDADPNRPGSGTGTAYALSWHATTTAGTLSSTTGTGGTFTFTPSAAGTVVVTLTATDPASGVQTSYPVVIGVEAAAPAAGLTVTPPVNPSQGQPLTWTAALTPAVAGTTYAWSVFGPDGVTRTYSTGTSGTLTVPSARPGRYDVTVTATANGVAYTARPPQAGTSVDIAPATVSVAIAVGPPAGVFEGDAVTLTGTATAPGVDLSNLSKASYLWTVTGPNGFSQVGVVPTLKVVPLLAGTYTATLLVRDFTGGSGTATVTFAVAHAPPKPLLRYVATGPTGITEFEAVVANPGGAYSFWYTVEVGGQTPIVDAPGGSAYRFALPAVAGPTRVVVSVTDSAGATGQIATTVQAVAAGAGSKVVTAADLQPNTDVAVVLAGGGNAVSVDPALTAATTVQFIAVGGFNTFYGGKSRNIFYGDSGTNVLVGGDGPNTFFASGNDTLVGGAGENWFVPVTIGTDTGNVLDVTAGTGANTLDLSRQDGVTLDLTVTGAAQPFDGDGNALRLTGSFQTVIGTAGADTLTAGSGTSVDGGGGSDLLKATDATNVTLAGGSGNNTSLVASGGGNISLVGGSGGNSSLVAGGGATNVTLVGGSGNNSTLVALAGNVSLVGGSGNNSSLVAGGGSTNVSLIGGSGGNSSLLALGGNVSLVGGSGSNSTLVAGGGSTNVSLVGGSGSNTSLVALSGNVSLVGGSGSNATLAAGAGATNVSLIGGSGSNSTLVAGAGSGNVTLVGGSGSNASLLATAGNVSLVGGSGSNSTLIAGGGSANVTLVGGSGSNSTLVAGAGSTNVSLVGGSGGNASLVALGGNVSLVGGSGNNSTLVAGNGSANVSLVGGSGGNSSLVAGGGSTNVTLVGGSGNNATLAAGTGSSNVSLVGGSGGNSTLVAGVGNVTLVGGSGNNASLVATAGNVSLVGGSGNNSTLVAGTGSANVTLVGGSGNNATVVALGGNVSLVGGSGGNASLVAGGGSTNVTLVGGSGNNATLVAGGGSANVTLVGGSGSNSSLVAGSGSSNVSLIGGSGGNSSLVALAGNVSLVGGSGSNATLVTGGGSRNVTLVGGSGNNASLSAGAGSLNVSLVGGSGSNASLVSGSGSFNVSLIGGSGNNTSLVSSGGTNVSLVGGSGDGTRLSVIDAAGALLIGGSAGNAALSASGTSTGVILIGGFGDNNTLAASAGVSGAELVGGFGKSNTLDVTEVSHAVLVGGFGDGNSLTATGGNDIVLIGGSGNNNLLRRVGGTNSYLLGQSGNNTSLVSSGGANVSLVGGSGDRLYLSDTGGTNVSLLGGSGSNDTVISIGGTNATVFGGNGDNNRVSAVGGTNVFVVGGTGSGNRLSAADLRNSTVFGGAGNSNVIDIDNGTDLLVVGGTGLANALTDRYGTRNTVVNGGNGVASLTAVGGNAVRLFGGGGTDYLAAAGGLNVGLFGQNGDNTYSISGSAANPFSGYLDALGTVGLEQSATDELQSGSNTILFPTAARVTLDLGLSVGGAATAAAASAATQPVAADVSLYLIGGFSGVVGSAAGNDFIRGNGWANSLVAGAGDATLIAGSGDATLVAGSGRTSLVGGGGQTTYTFRGAAGQHTITQTNPDNTDIIDLSGLTAAATLDLGVTAPQTVAGSLTLTLTNPTVPDVLGSPFGNTLTGNGRDNHFSLGGGTNTITAGAARTTLKYAGGSLGANTVTAPTPGSVVLNFHELQTPLTFDLGRASQPVAGGTVAFAGAADARAVASVVGTVYGDVLTGNPAVGAPGVSLYGGGGRDSLTGGAGADLLQAGVPQVVFLDFDTYTPLSPNNHIYTQPERDAIEERLRQMFAAFASAAVAGTTGYANGYVFTQSRATARALTRPTGGEFVTVSFNRPPAGGQAEEVDFGNANLGGAASVDASLILGKAGEPDRTTENFIRLSAGLAAHEVAHLAGLRHTDAFGPIGAGGYVVFLNGEQVAGLDPTDFYPVFQQPAGAQPVTTDAVALLAGTSVPAGATVYAAETPWHVMGSPASIGLSRFDTLNDLFFGEREAIRLAFATGGVALPAQAAPHGSMATARDLGTLPGLVVPNTLAAGAQNHGQSFAVAAVAVAGSIGLDATGQSRSDWYAFDGRQGEVMSFEVLSGVLPGNRRPLDTIVRVYDYAGALLASNDDELESLDSLVFDIRLPAGGRYYVQVDTWAEAGAVNTSQGDYMLYVTSFKLGASLGGGSTLVAGPGGDVLYGGQGNTEFRLAPDAGPTTVIGGNGADVLDRTAAPLAAVTVITPAGNAGVVQIAPIVVTAGGPFAATEGTPTGPLTVATFTDPSVAGPASSYAATIDWGDGTHTTATVTGPVGGVYQVVGGHTYASAGPYTVSVTVVHGGTRAASAPAAMTVSFGQVTATGGINAPFASAIASSPVVATFTDPNGAGPLTLYSATIDWGDGTASAGTVSGPVDGVFSVSAPHTYFVLAAPPTITVSIARGTAAPVTVTSTAVVGTSIVALSASLSGAVTLTGSATIGIGGALVVNSNSNKALTASGSARVTAGSVRVVGGYSRSGSAQATPAPATGAAVLADPLAHLPAPPNPGGTPTNANIGGSSTVTLNPGLYSRITVGGSARVTLNPGVYVIAGGNLSVSGGATLTGTGVMIYVAGGNYPSAGGTFGGVSFSGSAAVSLTPAATGTYAGIALFQARDNNRALAFSGNAREGVNGFVYAPNALLTLSGSVTTVRTGFVVDRLNTSGSASSGQVAAGSATEDGNPAGELLATSLTVYVDPADGFTPAQRARIAAAITSLDALVEPHGVDVVEVSDPAEANVVIDLAPTTVLGGAAAGVLAVYDPVTGAITIVDGWDWYAGADPAAAGAGQFDFQTVVTHELGHALGLGHLDDPASVMYEWLTPGTAKRTIVSSDLNIGNEHGLPGALYADLSGWASAAESGRSEPRTEAVGSPEAAASQPVAQAQPRAAFLPVGTDRPWVRVAGRSDPVARTDDRTALVAPPVVLGGSTPSPVAGYAQYMPAAAGAWPVEPTRPAAPPAAAGRPDDAPPEGVAAPAPLDVFTAPLAGAADPIVLEAAAASAEEALIEWGEVVLLAMAVSAAAVAVDRPAAAPPALRRVRRPELDGGVA